MPKSKRLRYLANGPNAKLFTAVDVKQTVASAIEETKRFLTVRPCV